MTNPMTAIWNCETETETIREMTDNEYAELLASGWSPEPQQENVTE